MLFLTKNELETNRGRALQKHLGGQFENDVKGHGAIEWYYNLEPNSGTHNECTDFSSPDNFPNPIVSALKKGVFCGIGISEQLLTGPALAKYEENKQTAWAEYEKIRQPAWAEYKEIEQPALAKYEEIKQPALAEYEKNKQPALAEYEEIEQTAWDEYKEIEQPALAKYKEIEQPALAKYKEIKQPALAEYYKIKQAAFWKLFQSTKNRVPAWR